VTLDAGRSPAHPYDGAAVRVAVVDLGTNSTRLLVAEVVDGRLNELARRTRVTRLGEGVDRGGRLLPQALERVFEALADYRRLIDDLEAERVVAVATSAVRDAENRDELLAAIERRFGLRGATIRGDEEARLTFLGATAERADRDTETLVFDIGGGSTEYVVGRPGSPPGFQVSTPLGSVRHTERHLRDDPPPPEQVEELAAECAGVIREEVPERVRRTVSAGIAVAGTATSLAAIDQRLDPYDPVRVHGYPLRMPACQRMLAMLAALPVAKRRQVTGLHPDRAPTIVAGAVILVESMRAFELEAVEASEADILHGAALEAAGEGRGESRG
jgi:exopolyphosphatase / guanosine-5'-triphosphate,3'-diphosphate pyrophosphatase